MARLTDRPDMTLDVYRGRKTTIQQYNNNNNDCHNFSRGDVAPRSQVLWDRDITGKLANFTFCYITQV